MAMGELIGKGTTAEVYAWGKDKVVKLFLNNYKTEWIRYEAEVGRKVNQAGVPSPVVFDIVENNGRKGIVFQRIQGKTILSDLEAEPWMFYGFIGKMAALQHKIHLYSADSLPAQKEKLASAIQSSSEILGAKVKRILRYMHTLPEGNSVCHGDFHLGNIIVSQNKLTAIDWVSACKGDPAGDVAQTCLIINSPAVPAGTPGIIVEMARYPKWLTYRYYVSEYMRATKVKFKSIDAWILPMAAARLIAKIPGEEKWLTKIINQRLEEL